MKEKTKMKLTIWTFAIVSIYLSNRGYTIEGLLIVNAMFLYAILIVLQRIEQRLRPKIKKNTAKLDTWILNNWNKHKEDNW
jgi:uncharacterized protein (DUF58 family)